MENNKEIIPGMSPGTMYRRDIEIDKNTLPNMIVNILDRLES